MEEQEVYANTIYRVVHGSRAYGTHRPDSDRDEKGVCIPSHPSYYFGEHLRERAKTRKLDHDRLELIIAEIEDMKSRHHSAYLKIKCNTAVNELKKAQHKLLELNLQFEEISKCK